MICRHPKAARHFRKRKGAHFAMKWYKNLRVKAKLITSFGLVIVLALGLAAVAVLALLNTDASYSYLLAHPQKGLEYLMSLDKECADMRRTTTAVTLNIGDDETVNRYWMQYEQGYAAACAHIDTFRDLLGDDEVTDAAIIAANRNALDEIRRLLETYRAHVQKAVDFAHAGDVAATNATFLAGASSINAAVDIIAELIAGASEATAQMSEKNTGDARAAVMLLIGVVAVMMVISVAVALSVAKQISKPLRFLANMMMAFSTTGRLRFDEAAIAERSRYAESRDEIGEIAQGVDGMMRTLQNKVKTLETVANSDLTATIDQLSAEDTIAVSLQKMVDSLNDMFSGINSASDQVATGAKQIADGAQMLAQGSSEQASAIEELSSSIAQVAEKTRGNATMASQAAGLADTIRRSAEESSGQMTNMTLAVQEIKEASQSISRVIKVIDDIAFQTNILALNAAVEAAHAGQQGKGFAVVAEEVRNLANKSAEAARDTGRLIADSMNKAEYGSQVARETAESLAQIVAGIGESARLVGNIAKISEEQSHSVSQINASIEQVAQVVQQNSATAQQSAAAAMEMSGQSMNLRERLESFKLLPGTQRKPQRALHAADDDPAHDALPDRSSGFGKY